MNNKDITLYVFNYNGLYYIHDCLSGVLKQSMKPKKTIVIDNCSTDSSVDIAIDKGFIIKHNSKNIGIAAAQQWAINNCKTKYAAFLHVDVTPSSDWLETLYDTIEKEKAAVVEGEIIHNNDQVLHGHTGKWFNEELISDSKRWRYSNSICTAATIIRTGLLKTYFPPYYFHYGEDIFMSQSLLRAGYKLVHECNAKAYHIGGSYVEKSSLFNKILFKYLSKRNQLFNMLEFGINPNENIRCLPSRTNVYGVCR